MKLAKIEIANFRCFETLTVDLHPEVNVIVGVNGAGKTSILDAIAIALHEIVAANGRRGKRERAQQKTALQPTDIRVAPGTAEALVGRKDFVQLRATARDFYPTEGFPATTRAGQPAALEWTGHIRYRPPAGFSYDASTSERLSAVHRYIEALWDQIRKSAAQARIPLPVVAYYRAHRRPDGAPDLGNVFSLELSREQAFVRALDAGADFQAVCQWFYLRENAELRARTAEGHNGNFELPDLRALRRALRTAIAGVERIFFDGNPPRLKVALGQADGETQTLELGQLSDGYKSLMALVLDFARRLAQAHPTWPQPLDAPGILLVDELDLHLHPKWQQAVIPRLREVFPDTQLIIATHSPALLTTVRREQVRLLGTDHQFVTLPDDVGTYGAESSRVLAEVFGTGARPPLIDTGRKLQEYLGLIEARQHDGERARALRSELETALGRSDPDLLYADIRIHQLRVLGKG